jgi:hypothetical protein
VNDYLILQYATLIFGLLPVRRFPPHGRANAGSKSALAQYATTMYFPHFVGGACSREPD